MIYEGRTVMYIDLAAFDDAVRQYHKSFRKVVMYNNWPYSIVDPDGWQYDGFGIRTAKPGDEPIFRIRNAGMRLLAYTCNSLADLLRWSVLVLLYAVMVILELGLRTIKLYLWLLGLAVVMFISFLNAIKFGNRPASE